MQRKLTAILSADVVGYSGLMEADETGTLERLKANRSAIFDPNVAAHGGRVFKLMGDGALVEFPSVVAAVNCALAIQEATGNAEGELAEAKRIRYRIGVNLGDIIIDGDDIYGDGVNIAARLQMLAPAGGVALSRTVRDNVQGKLPCEFEDLGEHTVKNIETPVHVFAVRAAARKGPEGRKSDTRRRLSICVLPFANMSGDIEQEYFSDGISEDIITDLSKVSALFVSARNTAFQFKGKNVDVVDVARQLQVGHILEGSVRKAGGRVRINAQLIDGNSGRLTWAERYDRDLSDIFALQDEISQAIVAALKLKLLPEEKEAITQRGTSNLEAYNLYLMARQYYASSNYGNVQRYEAVVRMSRGATDIDPNYAAAWALMASAQAYLRLFSGGTGDGGMAAAERALTLDNTLADAHAAKARFLMTTGAYAEALSEIETAMRLGPESYDVNRAAASLSYLQRRHKDAIRYFETAAAMVETDFYAVGNLISCYLAVGDTESARRAAQRTLAITEKILAQEADNVAAMGSTVLAFAVLGEVERAKAWIRRATLLDPNNMMMVWLFARALAVAREFDAALDLLGPAFEKAPVGFVTVAKITSDLDPIREHPRFKAMLAAAEARLAAQAAAVPLPPP